MATALLKFLLPAPLRRPLQNLNIIPYHVPAFHPPPIQVPNQHLFLRSISYLQPYLPRPRLRRMSGLKSVINRRQRAKYCTCPDCQSKRFVNRVWPTSYFRRSRLSYYKNAPPQVCKRKFSTDSRSDDIDPGGSRFWTRMRRALKATKLEWYPIPIALGIAYVAFAHLRKMRERGWQTAPSSDAGEGKAPTIRKDVKVHGPWQFYVLSTLPLRSISRLWGRFNGIELPVFMRVPGYKLYSWIFGCRLDELKEPDLTKYRNLAEFFSRELKDGARVIDSSADLVPLFPFFYG
jgi:hypothetical protein